MNRLATWACLISLVVAASVFTAVPAQIKVSGGGKITGTVKGKAGSAGGGCTGTLCNDLVASWKLADLADATGRGNTLTNNNSATFVTGHIGDAVNLVASSSQSLSKASSTDVELNGSSGGEDWEIALWVKLADKTTTYWLISKDDDGSDGGYNIQYDQSADRFTAVTYYSGGSILQIAASNFGSPSAGTWYAINAWYDGGDLRISVNDGTPNSTGTVTTDAASTSTVFWIGKLNQFGGIYANAAVDNVNIWKGRILTSGERTAWYNSGTGLEYPYSVP